MSDESHVFRKLPDGSILEIDVITNGLYKKIDALTAERDALQAKLNIALTDLHDTTAQLVMDEEIEENLRTKLDIAVEALKQISLYFWDNEENGSPQGFLRMLAREALKKLKGE